MYVPNGRKVDDPHYVYKLDWLSRLRDQAANWLGEETALVWASKRVGRPIKWTAERSESFLTDCHGRDHVTQAELGTDAEGRFVALKVHTTANLGAYLSNFGPFIPTMAGSKMYAAVYTTPKILYHVKGVFTNTVPEMTMRSACAFATPAATVPTPTSATSLTETNA